MTGYQFTVLIRDERAECRFSTPEASEQTCEGGVRREHLQTIRVLERWLQRWEWIARADTRNRLLVPATFELLGDSLWRLAFDGDVGNRLLEAHARLEQDDDPETEPMRVRIGFHESADDLADLPWEFLRFPGTAQTREFFLAQETHLVLERRVHGYKEIPIRDPKTRLRVLLVVALPRISDFDDERRETEALTQVLMDIDPLDVEVVPDWHPKAVTDKLDEMKAQGAPADIVQLVGVCRDVNGAPQLFLPSPYGGEELVDPGPVVQVLSADRRNLPALVVLHLSDWDNGSSEHFEQLAPSFVRAGIPAVLAMQYPMPPEAGREFVRDIYARLALGERVGEAVQAARRGLVMGYQPNRQFGAPVLYLQSPEDGALLRHAARAEDEPEDELPAGRLDPSHGVRTTQAVRPRAHTTTALLRALDRLGPPDAAAETVRAWIESQQWPDDRERVRLMLRHGARQLADDQRARRVLSRLLESPELGGGRPPW